MTLIELIATVFGVACVLLYVRRNIWAWPTGLVQVMLFAWVFYHAKLYSDFLLHLVYIVLQVYGWYHWVHGAKGTDELAIRRLSQRAWLGALVIALVVTFSVGFVMSRYTDAHYAYWDASVMVLSLIAQYLLARKVLENWIFWIGVDGLAIGLYFVKELYITTGLYTLFLGLAVAGLIAWKRSLQIQASHAAGGSSSGNFSPPTAATSSSSILGETTQSN